MPPLKKWKDEILSDACWDDLRELMRDDAEEICAWDGWHWIIKAQLEMFFGLKDEYVPEKMFQPKETDRDGSNGTDKG